MSTSISHCWAKSKMTARQQSTQEGAMVSMLQSDAELSSAKILLKLLLSDSEVSLDSAKRQCLASNPNLLPKPKFHFHQTEVDSAEKQHLASMLSVANDFVCSKTDQLRTVQEMSKKMEARLQRQYCSNAAAAVSGCAPEMDMEQYHRVGRKLRGKTDANVVLIKRELAGAIEAQKQAQRRYWNNVFTYSNAGKSSRYSNSNSNDRASATTSTAGAPFAEEGYDEEEGRTRFSNKRTNPQVLSSAVSALHSQSRANDSDCTNGQDYCRSSSVNNKDVNNNGAACPHPNSNTTAILGNVKSRNPETTPACNCRKSRCLKMYCECFTLGVYCYGCNCMDCYNTSSAEPCRAEAVATVLIKRPDAFRSKSNKAAQPAVIDGAAPPDDLNAKAGTGCKCKKTRCLKKYCVCYNNGATCSKFCCCVGCENRTPVLKIPPKPPAAPLVDEIKALSSNTFSSNSNGMYHRKQ